MENLVSQCRPFFDKEKLKTALKVKENIKSRKDLMLVLAAECFRSFGKG